MSNMLAAGFLRLIFRLGIMGELEQKVCLRVCNVNGYLKLVYALQKVGQLVLILVRYQK